MKTQNIKFNERINIYEIESETIFKKKLVKYFKAQIDERTFNFLLPGGDTPLGFYQMLSEEEINWKNIVISPTDERLVGNSIENYKFTNIYQIKKHLVDKLPIKNKPTLIDIAEKKNVNDILKNDKFLNNFCAFLGIGIDGHTASIFQNDNYDSMFNYFTYTENKYGNFHRVSWNKKALMLSKKIFFILKGKQKNVIVKKIYQSKKDNSLPFMQILNEFKGEINILWCKR
tara:strand:+ start:325 stop:1014 length:690 start_codon:yes stop_codon:yes gene_type:complete